MSDRVTITIEHGVAELRLARSEHHNAIDPALVGALASAVDAVSGDPAVRALLITAEGPAFTVGGDLRHLHGELDRLPEALDEMIAPYHAALAKIAELTMPVICAVQGAVAGGGLGLLWCSDIVFATPDARLAMAFARIGLSGDGGSSWYLPRIVGMRRATELIIEGRVLSAAEALELGLISRVVEPAELQETARETARALAAGPTLAFGEMRKLIRSDGTLREGLEAERAAMVRLGSSHDAREGLAAFAQRRSPRFEGR